MAFLFSIFPAPILDRKQKCMKFGSTCPSYPGLLRTRTYMHAYIGLSHDIFETNIYYSAAQATIKSIHGTNDPIIYKDAKQDAKTMTYHLLRRRRRLRRSLACIGETAIGLLKRENRCECNLFTTGKRRPPCLAVSLYIAFFFYWLPNRMYISMTGGLSVHVCLRLFLSVCLSVCSLSPAALRCSFSRSRQPSSTEPQSYLHPIASLSSSFDRCR